MSSAVFTVLLGNKLGTKDVSSFGHMNRKSYLKRPKMKIDRNIELFAHICNLLWLVSCSTLEEQYIEYHANASRSKMWKLEGLTMCILNVRLRVGVERNQKQRTGIVSRTSWFASGYHCLNIVQLVHLCYHFLSQRVFYMTDENCFPSQNIPHYLKYTYRK